MTICGAVMFENIKKPQAGWACVAKGAAFRVRGTGDLSTDVVWWTNLDWDSFSRIGGLNQPKLRRTDYLRPNMKQLCDELGLVINKMPPADITEHVAEIFGRVMNLAGQHYGLDRPYNHSLAEDLYDILIRQDDRITPEIDHAISNAKMDWVRCETPSPKNSTHVTFRRPRVLHALEVISTPIPGDQWDFVPGNKMPDEKKRVDWLIREPRPVLVKAAVLRVETDVNAVIAYSAKMKSPKDWITHPELIYLSRFASIRVESAFIGRSYEPFQVKKSLFTGGVFGPLSVSTGILCENYWFALTIPRPYKRGTSASDGKLISPRAAWLSSSDRFHTIMPALMMHGSGFNIQAYGRGAVVIAVQQGALRDAQNCATAAGLLSPLNVSGQIAIREELA